MTMGHIQPRCCSQRVRCRHNMESCKTKLMARCIYMNTSFVALVGNIERTWIGSFRWLALGSGTASWHPLPVILGSDDGFHHISPTIGTLNLSGFVLTCSGACSVSVCSMTSGKCTSMVLFRSNFFRVSRVSISMLLTFSNGFWQYAFCKLWFARARKYALCQYAWTRGLPTDDLCLDAMGCHK